MEESNPEVFQSCALQQRWLTLHTQPKSDLIKAENITHGQVVAGP